MTAFQANMIQIIQQTIKYQNMKQFIYSLAVATTLLSTVSCDDNEIIDTPIPDSQKEMISFSLSDGTSQTRAGFTEADTKIVMRIQSNDRTNASNVKYTRTCALAAKDNTNSAESYSSVSFNFDSNNYTRYWDDAHGRKSLLSVYAIAVPNKKDEGVLPINTLNEGITGSETGNWGSNNDNSLNWNVELDQTLVNIANKDLVYSNNISKYIDENSLGKNGIYRWDYSSGNYKPDNTGAATHENGQMLFYQNGVATNLAPTEAAGHFDRGHMVFNHALTRLTVNLKRGTGFASGSSYFKFADGTNITLMSVPTNGKLDLATGTWSTDGSSNNDINKMAELTANSGFDHSLMAQFIPGYTFNSTGADANNNVMSFTIDDNTYYITQAMVFKALNDKAKDATNPNGLDKDAISYTMEQGKNYVLEITVKKTGIESVTATLVGWAYVTSGNIDATNSYITISSSTMDKTTTSCNHFDLYRLDAGVENIYTDQNGVTLPEMTNWGGNYTDRASTLEESSTSSGVWKTNWYWDSNKSFYHFRTVDKGMTLNNTSDGTDDNFKVCSGPVKDNFTDGNISTAINDGNYNDYHWGAPMKNNATLTYNATTGTNEGYSQSLYYAIGSTKDQIDIIEQHMMATVHFVLHTGNKADGTDVSSAAVSLLGSDNKGTRLTITNFAGEGTIKVGNGFIEPSNTMISSDIPVPGASSITYSATTPYILSSLTTSSASFFKTATTETNAYSYRVVPQTLYRGSESNIENESNLTNFVGLTIVTPDDNQYYVIKKLYGVEGTISNQSNKTEHQQNAAGKAQIIRWYPGYDYTYHIYINKTGIEAVTCTVVDWVKVTGDNIDIDLED